MYIKLNFTADKPLNYCFRLVDAIINNTDITSIATLNSTATSGTWHSSLLANLDSNNSEIVRTGTGITGLTSLTKSHFAKPNIGDDLHVWTMEFSVYDNPSTKYYVQQAGLVAGNYTSSTTIGTAITSGAMSTGAFPVTAAMSTFGGTSVVIGGTTQTGATASATTTSGFQNVRTFWMYITDTCMIWGTTNGTTYNVGFGPTYSSSAASSGPWIFSQYTRFDYHNTNANGVIPLMIGNLGRGIGGGFGWTTNDWAANENVLATSQNTQAFKVLNLINAYPNTGASFPVVTFPAVNWGIGSRFTDTAALNATAAGGGTSLIATTYGAVINNTVSTRYPSADLKTLTYAMLPVAWRHLNYYNAGGDASAQGGFFVFNGDYFPGDEFTDSGKTYKIIPTWTGYSQRVGIAIPKE
jgi:hypothetical protein